MNARFHLYLTGIDGEIAILDEKKIDTDTNPKKNHPVRYNEFMQEFTSANSNRSPRKKKLYTNKGN